MEKRNRKAGHSYSLRDRILAQIMVIIVTLTMIPFDSLVARAATTTNVKSIGSIQTEYEVDNGTSKDDIGLPSELSVIIETVTSAEDSTSGITNEYSEDTVEKSVSWEGDYNGDKAGTYTLRAEFDDSSLYYDDMPTVYVTVREPETTEEEPAEVEPAEEEPVAEEPAADEKAIEEVVTEEPVTQEAAPKEAQKDGTDPRVKSSLNEIGDLGNMRTTLTNKDGSPITGTLHAGDEFLMKLEFWETPGENGIQFDMNRLYYYIPSAYKCLASHDGESEVKLITGDGDQLVLVSPFTVDKMSPEDLITYIWNQEEDDDNTYARIAAAENVRIEVTTVMCINENGGEITFEDGEELDIDLSVGITVIKENSINGDYVLTPADKEEMVFGIFDADNNRVKDADGNDIEFTFGDMADQGNNQAKISFTGLPAGTYTVREISTLDIPDYTFSSTSVTQITQPISASKEATFHLKNIYVQDSGKLVLKKNFANGSALNDSNLTEAQKKLLTFHVTDTAGKFDHTYYYDEFTNGELTLNDLAVGTYHVVETWNDPQHKTGYELVSSSYVVKVDGTSTGSGSNNAAVDVEMDKESEVAFTNDYRRETGSLKLTKDFTGNAVTDALKSQITFTITGPDNYSRTVTYAELENGSITLTDLPTGTYTIKEENRGTIPTGTQMRTYINGSTTVSTTLQTTASVTNGATANASFRNDYRKVGSLEITKDVTCDNDYVTFARFRSKTNPKPYIIVTGPNNYSSGKIYFSANGFNSGTYTINNLPIGDYTVTEYDGEYSTNYTLKVTYDGSVTGNGTTAPGKSTVPQGRTGKVTIHNDYTRNKGKIHIEKALSGDITSIADFKSKFTDQSTVLFTVSNGTYSYEVKVSDLDPNGKITLDVPTGSAAYTITEINADLENYIRTTTVTLDGRSSANPTSALVNQKGQEHTAVFTNKYQSSGKLKITKDFLGSLSAAEIEELSGLLRFEILDADNNDAVVTINGKSQFTLAEMINGIDLPVGNYKVRELNDVYHPEIYSHDAWSVVVNGGIETRGGTTSATQQVFYGQTSFVYFYNEYGIVGTGVELRKDVVINGLPINTEVEYDPNLYTQEQIELENYVKDHIRFVVYRGSSATGTPIGTYSYRDTPESTAAGIQPITELELEPGTYTIVETNYEVDDYTAYIEFSVSGAVQAPKTSDTHTLTFTVVANSGSSRISFIVKNGYQGTGSLVVKKTFGSGSALDNENLTEEQKKAITFTVTGYNSIDANNQPTGNPIFGPETFSYFDMEKVDGVFQKKFEEIPIGYYTVEESNGSAIINLYEPDVDRTPEGDIVVTLGDETQTTFINTYTRRTGNLVIEKTIAGLPLNDPNIDLSKMTFTVTGPDNYSATKTYDQFTNGKWTINNLPTGTYTVKETGADYEDHYYERTTTVSVNDGAATSYSDAAGVSGAVNDGETLKVNLINTYKEVGALIFNKSFIDDEAINKLTDEQKAAVAFIVKRGNDEITRVTYAQIKEAVEAGKDGYKILVEPGDYNIIESADITGYVRTTTVTVNEQSATYNETTGVAAHVEKFNTAEIVFVNEYKEIGKLTVTKNIQYAGNLTEDQQKEFKFTVTGPDDNVIEGGIFTYYDMVKDNTGKVGTKTFENLPAGTYHIKEEILHEGDDETNPFYGLVRTTTIEVGTNKTNGLEADFEVAKTNPNVVVTNKYDNLPPLTVVKRDGGYPIGLESPVIIDGVEYPIWKFTLDISNLSVATTENGTTTIKDTYDVPKGANDPVRPEWFRTLTAEEAVSYVGDANANKLIPVDENGNADGTTVTITQNDESTGSIIKIDGVSENTTPNHTMTFYLIPKDKDSLGLLNLSDELDEAEEGSTEVVKSFNNNIQYKELPLNDWTTQKTPVEYNYRYEVLQKKAINYDAGRKCFYNLNNPDQVVSYAVYEVVMNKDAQWIGTEPTLDCEDTFSQNQYVDESSIEFFRYNGDVPEPVDVNWVRNGYTISFKIDNGKRYVMRYRSDILYGEGDLNQSITITNEFKMTGKIIIYHPEYVPTSLGDASEDYIKLRKADKDKNNIELEGAVFALYHSVEDAENDQNRLGTYTTGADGTVKIDSYTYTDGSGTHTVTMYPGDWALKEISAPPGYELIDYTVRVRLADRRNGEIPNPQEYIFIPTTTVGVKDKPYEGKVELGALKELIGSNVDIAAGDYSFTLTGVDGAPTGKASSDEADAPTGPVTVANDASGKARFGEILYKTSDLDEVKDGDGNVTGYEKTFKYKITEVQGDKAGITYDKTEHNVDVIVSSNDETKKLDVVVKIDGKTVTADDANVYFANISNEYNAEGKLVLGAKKTIKGRKLRVEEFTFEAALNDADNTVVSAKNAEGNVYNCDIVFPKIKYVLDEGEEEGYKDTTKVVKENDGTYTVYIDPDVLSQKDGDGHRYADYQYTIKEAKNDQLKGITFDETRYPVTVRVTDLDNGELKITVLKNNVIITEFFSNFKFENVYKADGQATLTGDKIVENDEQELAAGTYEFNVYDITNGEKLIGKVTHGAASAGNLGAAIKFPTIKAVVLPDAADDDLGMKVNTGNDGYVKDITITYHNIEDFAGKVFKFKFNELHGGEVRDGIQYSNTSYEATVTVAANSTDESKLDVNLVKNANEFNFINTPMEAEGQATPKGTKVLNGRQLKEGEFKFDLYYGNKVIGHVTNEAGGKIKYPVIKFVLDAGGTEGVTVDSETNTTVVTITVRSPQKLTKSYEFTVMENKTNPSPGIVYPLYPEDRKTFTATAKMKQGSNTEIEVTLTDADALDFTNTYGANGEDTPVGKKILEGRDLRAGEFWFGILDKDGNEIGKVTNDLSGKILYPTFRYVVDSSKPDGRTLETANGQLTAVIITVKKAEDLAATEYKAYEIEQSEAGIIYDTTTEQKITVTPTVDPQDESKLSVTAKAEEGKVFTNTYYAEGQATPEGLKELTNRLPELGEFKFAIKEGNTVITDKITITDDLNDEENKKKIDYPTFKYTVDASKDAGTTYDEDSNTIIVNVQNVKDLKSQYNYTISEVIPEDAVELEDGRYYYKGVTYDVSVIKLTVNVGVNLNDQSRLNVTINKSTGNDFKNEYETKGELKLTAKKTLLGRILNSGEFTFELKDENGKVLQSKPNVKDTITFDTITYTQEDMDKDEHGFIKDTVYKYTVSEVKGNAGGVTYDSKEYKITVTLHDNKDGTMNVKVEDEFNNIIDDILAQYKFHNAFVNYYNAVGEGTFSGTKTLRGRQIKDGDDETVFTFKIAIGGKEFTLTNTGNEIKYPKLKFVVDSSLPENTVPTPSWEDDSHETIVVKAGVLEKIIDVKDATADPVEYVPKAYEYTVTEETGNAAGITYDTTKYTVTATVSLNKDDQGKLDVNVEAKPNNNVSFINTYRARGEGTGEGKKYLYGRVIKDKEFTFTITDDKSGKVLGTVVNDATGKIQYPTFKYVVDPDADNLGLWTEEDAEGHLITVTKVYDSKEALEADLKATYTVNELEGDKDGNTEAGITYDTAPNTATVDTIKVSVEVTKEKLEDEVDVAKLNVTVTTDPDAKFKNYYKAMGVKEISGSKKLTYRLPEDKEFEFVIKDMRADKEIIRIKSSDMINQDYSGTTIKYPKFRYIVDFNAEPGTKYDEKNNEIIVTVNWVEELEKGFTYKITEVDEGKDYFTYDTTEYILNVTVTPTEEEIEPQVAKLDVTIEDPKEYDFNNKYHAEGALQLYAEKTLLGRILNTGDFTFELNRTDAKFENVIEKVDTKDNEKDGSVTFKLIEYDLDSMDKDEHGYVKDTKYYYTVSEVVPEGAVENGNGKYTYNGVTYDSRVFQITATLHDNKKGLIVVTVKAEPAGDVTFFDQYKRYEFKFGNAFENFYHAEGENTISGTKTLRGRNLTEGEYQFEIKDTDGNVLATVSNDAEGNIKYPTFRYVVNHLADEEPSYVFDEANNTLTLTTNNLEDMVTPVDTSADPVEYESKDYVYTINEVIPEGAEPNEDGTYTFDGVTYNELLNDYTLTVSVAVNEEDMGILDVNIEPSEELDFINTYRAKGEDTVVGKKILKGADIKDFEGKFNFTVTDGEGNLITTVSNDAAGNILYPTFRYVVDPDLEAGAVYDEEENVYTVTVNAYEDLEDVYTFKVTELQGDIEDMAYNVGEKLEYEITVTVVADDKDHAILNVVAMPDTAVDFVNRQYFKAGLYKIDEDSSEALKGAVIRLVRIDDGKIIDEWTTDGTVHLINLIEIGTGTFRFVEVKTPEGYEFADDIEFKMSKDGEFSSEYDHVFDKNGNAVFIMRDPSIPNTKTGDEAPLAAAGGAFAVGLAGLAAVIASKKRRA